MKTKLEIAKNWLPRYTGTQIDEFGDYMLLTNFHDYVNRFGEKFNCEVKGAGRPFQTSTNADGLSIINFGMGSANAATIMDLLSARDPKGVLFLGKCGDYKLPEVPALPSFKLHKFVSDKIATRNLEYRTGVVYTTNRRVWEWDEKFKSYLKTLSTIAIDMETATLFIVGLVNEIPRGALLMVSDVPMIPEGVKTEKYAQLHLDIGIEAMTEIGEKGEPIKHFTY
jgi:AMP nucleosidase